jgi:hypothetical protein
MVEAAEALARRLVEAEQDDTIDVVGLIDEAPEDVRAAVAAVQRARIARSDVPGGGGFGGGGWRRVGQYAALLEVDAARLEVDELSWP